MKTSSEKTGTNKWRPYVKALLIVTGALLLIAGTSISHHYTSWLLVGDGPAPGTKSLSVGAANAVGDDEYGNHKSAAIGEENVISGPTCLAVGKRNDIDLGRCFAAGMGLRIRSWHSTAVGIYNEVVDGAAYGQSPDDGLFVVGNGASDGQRKNAFYVTRGGDVIVPKPQGDIDMGIFD